MTRGQPAPFAGVLLTTAALAKVVTELEARAERARVDLEAERATAKVRERAAEAVAEARLEAERAKRAAVEADLARQKSTYEGALSKANASASWYQSPYLHFLLGNVVAGGLCAAANRLGR